jgi:putative membrane protein
MIKTFLRGAAMGVAEIIPGVSGSTIALVFGIYDRFINFLHGLSDIGKSIIYRFINIFKSKKLSIKREKIDWSFGLTLLSGMFAINLLLANVIGRLLIDYPNYIQAFFFGLVVASIFIPISEMKTRTLKSYMLFIIAALATFFIVGLKPTVITEISLIYLFVAGMFGIMGMILPGISGAFILLMLGVYEHIITIVKEFTRLDITADKFLELFVFGTGIIIGFSVFVRVVKVGFKKYPNIILPVLSGIILGSLRALYPFFDSIRGEDGKVVEKIFTSPFQSGEYNSLIVIFITILGFVLIRVLSRFGREGTNVP